MLVNRVLIVLFAFTLTGPVWGWGREGHETVARIAENRLSEPAKNKVHQLLALDGSTSLMQIASWADGEKIQNRSTYSHTVRIPFNADHYSEKRDCTRRGQCAVIGILESERTLANRGASPMDQLKALKYLVHLVGDVHQPLHAIKQTGGFPVEIKNRQYTMHKVWDTIGVRALHRSPEVLAEELGNNAGDVEQLDPASWAVESHNLARNFIYHGNEEFARSKTIQKLPDNYLKTISPIIEARIAAGGVRLGNLLNTLLSPP